MKKILFWYLFITVVILSAGSILVAEGLRCLYSQIASIPKSEIPELNRILIVTPTILLWIPITFVLSNCVLLLFAKAAKCMPEVKKLNYLKNQKRIIKLLIVFVAFCIPLIIAGFLL